CVSSTRRHTSFSRDWSSDVCSSDLKNIMDPNGVLTVPTDLMFNETIINVGTEPWYDWHEVILAPPVTLPQSNWLNVNLLVNGNEIGRASCREREEAGGRDRRVTSTA